MAIAPDSASYPCLAVIQAHGLEARADEVYAFGRVILEAYLDPAQASIHRTTLPPSVVDHLARNYKRAADQFGWVADA